MSCRAAPVIVVDRVLTILGEWSTSTWPSTERCPASKFGANPLYIVDIPQAAGNTIRSLVLFWRRDETDRRTDGRTDGRG